MKRKRISRRQRSHILYGYLMIAPLTAGLGIFYFYPFFKVFYDSFHVVGAFNKRSWAGLSNYAAMFRDPVMWSTLWNTVRYVIVIVPAVADSAHSPASYAITSTTSCGM